MQMGNGGARGFVIGERHKGAASDIDSVQQIERINRRRVRGRYTHAIVQDMSVSQ